ncbi:MAG: AlkZ family DNA glycosylase [Microbacterium sp.]|uniref:winged helix DNA-binding domain-containing protein n=1 Tax=Microbacterium sp. TaxID=51671 RepID=UPI001ACF3895|nr:winged helix DNA-binding domain-containing protein [Microbacterium sp.]MBN9175784.1 AlkZ family DNA glycosylase [Microbacterium sp.]
MRYVSGRERRARLATRHALTPGARVSTPLAAAEAVVALHATEAPSVHLSVWARSRTVGPEQITAALGRDHALVKQLAMRRTLFAFPQDLISAVLPSAAARVATAERAGTIRDIERAGIAPGGAAWLDAARRDVVTALEAHGALSTAELRRVVPIIRTVIPGIGAETWSSYRLLTLLGAEGVIVRGPSRGQFPNARPLWTLASTWLDTHHHMTATEGYREIVRRWLHAFGPGTEEDLVWWLGATKTIVRTALTELEAIPVTLDGPHPGWLLPDDMDPVPDPPSWTALLPVLDPTVMGWKHRDFYLGSHAAALFDKLGNAGTTAWVNGRAVGCWTQDEDGAVQVHLLQPIPDRARRSLHHRAAQLTAWLDGRHISTGYRSSAMLDHRIS